MNVHMSKPRWYGGQRLVIFLLLVAGFAGGFFIVDHAADRSDRAAHKARVAEANSHRDCLLISKQFAKYDALIDRLEASVRTSNTLTDKATRIAQYESLKIPPVVCPT